MDVVVALVLSELICVVFLETAIKVTQLYYWDISDILYFFSQYLLLFLGEKNPQKRKFPNFSFYL